ncbi:MAG TPA: TolC family protein [Planctomycetes bacterium]|nr:TolC family protein [Planctomycetota bacterium]
MRKSITLTLLLALSACTAVDPEPSWQNVRDLSASRSEGQPVWVRTPEDQKLVESTVTSLLEGGLDRDEALRIAILNDPALQARFADIGVSAAFVVEASLPTNPTLDGWLGLPGRSGASSLGLIAWLSDLWIIPQQTAVAELEAKRTEFSVAADIMMTGLMGAAAWDRLVAARREAALARELLRSRMAAAKRMNIRYSHGLEDEGTVQEAVGMVAEQEVTVQSAEQGLTEARTALAQRLAVPEAWTHVPQESTLTPLQSTDLTVQEALESGMQGRLDIQIAHVDVERTTSVVGLEDALIWRSVGIGATKEGQFARVHDSNVAADEVFGPTISIEIPIFNQNQAGRAAASFELQQAIKLLEAARLRAAKEIVDAHRRFETTARSLSRLEGVVRPAAAARLKYVREWNRRMQITYLEVLAAEERLLIVDIEINRLREEKNSSWRRLQFAINGRSM